MAGSSPSPSAPLCPYCHASLGGESDFERRVLSADAGGTHFAPVTTVVCRSCRAVLGFT
jgi:hypothetical protein